MASERVKNGMPASRDMALSLLASYRSAAQLFQERPAAPAPATIPPAPETFSPTIMRLAQERSRQQRREHDLRARERQLLQAILRYEHRLAELRAELEKLRAAGS